MPETAQVLVSSDFGTFSAFALMLGRMGKPSKILDQNKTGSKAQKFRTPSHMLTHSASIEKLEKIKTTPSALR